jgi:hypothetical protein
MQLSVVDSLPEVVAKSVQLNWLGKSRILSSSLDGHSMKIITLRRLHESGGDLIIRFKEKKPCWKTGSHPWTIGEPSLGKSANLQGVGRVFAAV